MSGESMLTVNEAAARMAVQAATVRRWIKSKALGSVKAGPRSTRIPVETLRAFIESHTERAVTAGKRGRIAPRIRNRR